MAFGGNKILLFPVETAVRELDFRLILAVLCARPGWEIIVGEHEELFPLTLRLKNAILVWKNITGGKRPWKYQRYKANNLRIVQLDEEGGIFEGGEKEWKAALGRRFNVLEMDAKDYVCTWGPFQAEFYSSFEPACTDHIIATGHPRLELGKPRFRELFREEADSLVQRFGKFILINTNLVSNNIHGPDVLLKWYKVQPEDIEKRTHYIEHYTHEARREASFIELINHLSNAFPDHQIVLRPHPSEDIRTYRALFSYIPRVTVTRDGSLHAWLAACEALVHSGCTTAIEACLSGTPVINFQPYPNPRYEITLPNLVGVTCATKEAVVETLRQPRQTGEIQDVTDENLKIIQRMLINFGPDTDAFGSLAKVIGKCQDEALPTVLEGWIPPFLRRQISGFFSAVTRGLAPLRRLFHKQKGTEKFPPLDREMLAKKLEIIQRITGTKVNVRFHTSKTISITADPT